MRWDGVQLFNLYWLHDSLQWVGISYHSLVFLYSPWLKFIVWVRFWNTRGSDSIKHLVLLLGTGGNLETTGGGNYLSLVIWGSVALWEQETEILCSISKKGLRVHVVGWPRYAILFKLLFAVMENGDGRDLYSSFVALWAFFFPEIMEQIFVHLPSAVFFLTSN